MEYQERVKVEAEALRANVMALNKFIDSKVFYKIDKSSRKLLPKQLKAMYKYLRILDKRISKF